MYGLICCGIPLGLVILLIGGFWINSYYTRHFNRHFRHAWRARRGGGAAVEVLAQRLGVAESELRAVVPKYETRSIPKRSGGQRILHVPAPALMELQRKILRLVLGRLRAHEAAHGFERKRSIVTNANPHARRPVVIKMDITDFFANTRADRIEAYFRRIGWNREAAELLTRLVTHEGGLPQGAPTSPRLSNLINYRLDARIKRYAFVRRAVYTRYADDITLSFARDIPSRNRGVIQKIRRHLKVHGYALNEKKTRILRPHQQKRVTGLVVNEQVRLPRATRRWLRAIRHALATGKPASLSQAQVDGWAALEEMVQKQAIRAEIPKVRRHPESEKKSPPKG